MADTLVREAIAYGSQPLSPVPQYWDGSTSYAKAQGINGAIRVINYNSAGETFTAAIPGVMQVALSAGGSAAFSNTIPGTVQLVTSAGATNLFSASNPASMIIPVVGTQANAWSASATISSGATSNSIDLRYNYQIGYFGTVTNTASLTLAMQVSQDNTNFYQAATNTITAGTTSPFHYSATTAARYVRLSASGVSATITATVAGK